MSFVFGMPWQTIVLVLLVLCAFGYAYTKQLRTIPVLLFTRLGMLVLLLIALTQPAIVHYKPHTGKKRIAVLVDASYSMGIAQRFEHVRAYLARDVNDAVLAPYDVDYFLFSDDLQQVKRNDILSQSAVFPRATNLSYALTTVQSQTDCDAVLLFSDGNHTTSSGMNARAFAAVPIYTVAPDTTRYCDVSVRSRTTNPLLFTNVPAQLSVEVRGVEAQAQRVTVMLKEGGEILEMRSATFTKHDEIMPVTFSVTPKIPGIVTYSVEASSIDGEITTANNHCLITGRVQKNKTRVLYLCGMPSFEYRFLRDVLKNTPSIELVSFIILRTLDSLQPLSENELSLIPFPAQEIFENELAQFDVVILENFSFQTIFNPSYIQNVARYVENDGKTLIVIGGESSFAQGRYEGTALDTLLPLELNSSTERLGEGLFRLKVTRYTHPIMQLDERAKENKMLWDTMPFLDGAMLLHAKPGATVLGVHPNFSDGKRNPYPVIALWKQGRGIVLCTTNNTTWRWSLADTTQALQSYQTFWRNAVDYCAHPEKFPLIHLETDVPVASVGEQITFTTRISAEAVGNDASACDVALDITDPRGKTTSFSRNITPTPNERALCEIRYVPTDVGQYHAQCVITRHGTILGSAATSLHAEIPPEELWNVQSNIPLLKSLARTSKGECFLLDDPLAFSTFKKRSPTIADKINIGNSVVVLCGIIILLLIEWFERRRRGMR